MAPLFTTHLWEAQPIVELIMLHARQSDEAPRQPHQINTDAQSRTIQIVALTSSIISVASSALTLYWFMKMRRSFRHDLIMLLIQSDTFKALWFMIYPIVTFISGRTTSKSTFCQVNGFFLAVGVEASDFAVLMIAIHSALYIFKPNNSGGEGGLYPYRKIAYGGYILFPILLAALAFINPDDAYVSHGAYCYLPVRPFWYRLALAWIPRYLIFFIILVIYASIYLYVRYKFRGFAEEQSVPSDSSTICGPEIPAQAHSSRAASPELVSHGLIPDSRQLASERERGHRPTGSQRPGGGARRGSTHQFMLLASFTNQLEPAAMSPITKKLSNNSALRDHQLALDAKTHHEPVAVGFFSDVKYREPSNCVISQDALTESQSPGPRATPRSRLSIAEPMKSRNNSLIPRRSSGPAEVDIPLSELHLTNSPDNNLTSSKLLQTRDKITGQLRFLFIYPLVYIGMWIVPFVSHLLQYQIRYAHEPPFVLSCIVVFCVCMQAAVDSLLFSTREKPWQHIPGTQGGFWESLRFWTGWHGFTTRKVVKGPGKTRDEMVKEARSAYIRRDAEMAQRRMTIEDEAAAVVRTNGEGGSELPTRKRERSWWEDTENDLDSMDEA